MMASRRLSPLTLLLGCVFFFSTQVFAVSAVLGVDFGTEYIKAALVKPGIPLDIVLTKDSRRKETSAVAFKPSQSGLELGSYPERAYGSDAVALAARFPSDVYPNLKTLLGLSADEAAVQEYAARHPSLQLEKSETLGSAAFKSKAFAAEEDAWLVEELIAMQLQSIQKNAEVAAGPDTSVRSIVVTVPPFYTVEEKRAIQLAADLAGLKVLSLISDGLAVGLNYATTRQFPNINEGGKPEHHLVFDMGAGSTKATVMRFQSKSVKDVGKFNKTVQDVTVLGAGWDTRMGGDLLNSIIVDDMVSQFVESKPAQKASVQADNVKNHGRAIAKLSKEAERLRHILSANSNTQGSFEGLYEDIDFKYKISREDFEKMVEPYAASVAGAVREALEKAGLEMADLDSVILHGGASRTPFVQKTLEDIAGSPDKIRTNVNADEAAVFGAGFRAAELSPSFRVKEIRISEGGMYPSGMRWTNNKDKEQHQRLWSAISPQGGVPKEVAFSNLNDFAVTFYQQKADVERDTGVMTTQNLTATVAALKEQYQCSDDEIQFKVGVKLSSEAGEVQVVKAAVECEAVVSETFVDGVKNLFGFGKKDQKPLEGDETSEEASAEEPESSASAGTEQSEKADSSASPASEAETAADASADEKDVPKKQVVSIPVKVVVEPTGTPKLSADQLKVSKDRLRAFEASDKARLQREEALNQLEGFTYKVRDLLEGETFIAASTEEERTTLEQKSSEASDWLYGDGADAAKEEFKAKYKELNDIVTRIQKRANEAEQRPSLVTGLKEALDQTTVFVDKVKDQLKEYADWHASASTEADAKSSAESPSAEPKGDFDGLEDDDDASDRTMEDVVAEKGPVPPLYTQEDVDKVADVHAEITKWLEEMEEKQGALATTDEPVLLVKDLKAKRERLDKAGMDFAMKGVKNFDKKSKKMSSSAKKDKQTKTSATGTGTAAGEEPPFETIDLGGEDGQMPSQEELDEIVRKIQEKQKAKQQQEGHDRDEL